ncbi:hypothetical protein A2765_05660 [Candidatus Kaiserbacteria bacterium RIFCSPHIGHO2_01_FULL_56_24]|uniref:CARDB domain-containing protein n=1 Tax=Candidatus Kaiserbacteria bacterium RIFCSPHIGHO2_01_FULL_56_24 TaxID=1798487 RepID=A0A1F6DAJ2_9BACT|nr:MAG: hypothetical protein A2765_05660 [Candidatus Kaiserbacteria bacterium RIFCSPHIGHO2_01_FULL_56_24]
MTDAPQSQNPGLLANILAVAGFIILIVIIVWGAYHLLRLTGSGVSSLFSGFTSKTELSVTAPRESMPSGKAFPISWKFSTKDAGNYAFLYQCKSGFRFDVTVAGKATAIPCGSAFSVGTTTTLSLIPMLSGMTTLDVPVSIVFIPAATSSTATRPQGTATIHVSDGSVAAAPTPTPSTGGTTTPKPAQPAGKPDLSVRVLAVGVINPMTGAFETRYPSGPNDVAAVQFDIANNGGSSTGTWYFTVNLPMQGSYLYSSPAQASLTHGSHIVNTLRFKPVISGGGTITVSVDPTNVVKESNEGNNAGTVFITAPVWSGVYQPYVY